MEYGQSFYEYSCEMNMPLLQVGGHLKLRLHYALTKVLGLLLLVQI